MKFKLPNVDLAMRITGTEYSIAINDIPADVTSLAVAWTKLLQRCSEEYRDRTEKGATQ